MSKRVGIWVYSHEVGMADVRKMLTLLITSDTDMRGGPDSQLKAINVCVI